MEVKLHALLTVLLANGHGYPLDALPLRKQARVYVRQARWTP